jgi:CheY-like chemotaxis protein
MLNKEQKSVNLVKILVVDDLPHYRKDAENAFLGLGCTVITAVDGEDAWQKIESEAVNNRPFDMIVSDWQMPNIDGIELLKKIRESKHKALPFMLLTTEPYADAVKRANILYKPDAVLGKPANQHLGLFKVYVDALK